MLRVCQKRIKLSLITAVTNQGKLRWMVVDGAVNGPTFIRFLKRLVRDTRCKVSHLIHGDDALSGHLREMRL